MPQIGNCSWYLRLVQASEASMCIRLIHMSFLVPYAWCVFPKQSWYLIHMLTLDMCVFRHLHYGTGPLLVLCYWAGTVISVVSFTANKAVEARFKAQAFS